MPKNSGLSWDILKEQKITLSLATVVISVMAAWNFWAWSYDWHHSTFFSEAEAQEQSRVIDSRLAKLETKVDTQAKRMEQHMQEFRLYAAITRVSSLEEAMDRHCRQSGGDVSKHTPEQMREHQQIEHDLREAREYKACIVDEKSNCHLLQNQG